MAERWREVSGVSCATLRACRRSSHAAAPPHAAVDASTQTDSGRSLVRLRIWLALTTCGWVVTYLILTCAVDTLTVCFGSRRCLDLPSMLRWTIKLWCHCVGTLQETSCGHSGLRGPVGSSHGYSGEVRTHAVRSLACTSVIGLMALPFAMGCCLLGKATGAVSRLELSSNISARRFAMCDFELFPSSSNARPYLSLSYPCLLIMLLI